jgi:hypothetical protein
LGLPTTRPMGGAMDAAAMKKLLLMSIAVAVILVLALGGWALKSVRRAVRSICDSVSSRARAHVRTREWTAGAWSARWPPPRQRGPIAGRPPQPCPV